MPTLAQAFADPEVGLRRHRPAFGWCVAIVLGVALGFVFGKGGVWLGAAGATLVAAWFWRRQAAPWLCLACLCLSAWRGAFTHDAYAATEALLGPWRTKGATVPLRFVVSDDCRTVWRKRGGPYCTFTADNPHLPDGTPIQGITITINWYGNLYHFPKTGQAWEAPAKFHRVDWRTRAPCSVRGAAAKRLPKEDCPDAWRYRFARLRDRLAANLVLGVAPSEALVAQTMTLGARLRLPREELQRYADAGIIHVLSISGLHVGIVTGLLIWLLAWVGVRLRTRALLLIPALFFYLFLVGAPPPATRACVMASVWCAAPCFLRRTDAANALFVTAAAVTLWEPAWVTNAGAVLSFAVMGGIFLWMPPLAYFLCKALRVLPRQHDAPGPPPPTPGHVRLRRGLAYGLALSLSAWLASLPLCLHYFGRLSLIGLCLNLLIPAASAIIVWGSCVSACVGFVFPLFAIFLNRVSAFVLHAIALCSELALYLPGAVVECPRLGLGATAAIQAVILIGGIWVRSAERRARLDDPLDPNRPCFLLLQGAPTCPRPPPGKSPPPPNTADTMVWPRPPPAETPPAQSPRPPTTAPTD